MTGSGPRFHVTTPGGFYTMDAGAIRNTLSDYTGYLERETLWGLVFDKAETLQRAIDYHPKSHQYFMVPNGEFGAIRSGVDLQEVQRLRVDTQLKFWVSCVDWIPGVLAGNYAVY